MRRLLGGIGSLVALSGLVGAANASGPVPDSHFAGTGSDYLNNGPTWKKGATGTFSFRTSSDGKRMLGFRGTYYYYCGSGTASLSAGYLTVSKQGKFDYRFKQRLKTGNDYVEISGRFNRRGDTAQVSYLVDFVFKGHKVRDPYDVHHPHSLGCASWVRGAAKPA